MLEKGIKIPAPMALELGVQAHAQVEVYKLEDFAIDKTQYQYHPPIVFFQLYFSKPCISYLSICYF